MAQLKSENEALMHKAREERAAMLKDAKELGDKLVAEAREQAKIQANKIITDAQLSIDQQKNAAMVELKNSVGNMVVEVAEESIAERVVR